MRLGAVDERRDLAALRRTRHIVDDQVQDQVAADVAVGGGAHHRENAHLANPRAHAVENMFHRKRALLEELFHVGIVAFGDHFHQGFVRLLRLVGVGGRDVALLAFPVAIRRVGEGPHANQIDNTVEIALAAHGEVDRYGGASEVFLDAGQRALEIGALTIQLVHHNGARQFELFGEGPDFFGLHFHSAHAVHQDDRGIGRHQGAARIVNKYVVARRIQEIDLGLLPLGHGDGSRDRDFALDFLLVKIGDRVALIDAEKAVGGSGGEQQPGCERRLAGIAVAHDTNVPDILAFVDFHGSAPFLKRNGNTGWDSGTDDRLSSSVNQLQRGTTDHGNRWSVPPRTPPHRPEDYSLTHTASAACGPIPTPACRPPHPVSWRGPSSRNPPPPRWRYSSAPRRRPVPWRRSRRWPCPRRHPRSSALR